MSGPERFYLAAQYERREEIRGYRDELVSHGYCVTSRWIDQQDGLPPADACQLELAGGPEKYEPFALKDMLDLEDADTVISFTGSGGRGGRHVEFGMAIALEKDLIIVGPREHVFHTLSDIEWYADWKAFKEAWGIGTDEDSDL